PDAARPVQVEVRRVQHRLVLDETPRLARVLPRRRRGSLGPRDRHVLGRMPSPPDRRRKPPRGRPGRLEADPDRMIVLWLLAAHPTGDFLLQTRWQATRKFAEKRERLIHAMTYTAAFVPVAAVYGTNGRWYSTSIAFLILLAVAHYLTDSR